MGLVRLGRGVLVLFSALAGLVSAQSVELTPPLARGNLHRGGHAVAGRALGRLRRPLHPVLQPLHLARGRGGPEHVGRRAARDRRRPQVASVLLDGSAAPVVLSMPLAADRRVAGTPLATDEWVLFRADAELYRRYDLFAVPVDGSLPARRVNVQLGASNVEDHVFAGDEILFVAPSTPDYGGWALFRAPLAGGRPPRALNPPGTFITTSSGPGALQIHPDEHRVLFSAYSTSGYVPGSRLYLGFLGRPIRGAERP